MIKNFAKTQITRNKTNNNFFEFLIVIFFCLLLLLLPLPPDLDELSRRTLVLVLFAIVLWVRELLDPAFTALLLMILFPIFGILPYKKAIAGLGNTSILLLLGVFIISAAMQETGLDKRIALHVLKFSKGNAKKTLLMVIITTTLFLFLLPTSTGRVAIMLPICIGMINSMQLKKQSNFGKAILIAMSYTSLIGSIGLMTGSISIIYTTEIFESLLNYSWSYFRWFLVLFPIVIIIDFLIWILFLKIFPPEVSSVPGGMNYINKELNQLGKFTKQEAKILVLTLLMITLWIFSDYLHLSVSQACFLIALIAMLPGIEIISFHKAIQSVQWSVILLLGASLSIVEALNETQSIKWVAETVFNSLKGLHPSLICFFIMIILAIIRLGFPNLLTMTATTLPLVFSVAFSLNVNPIWLGLIGVCGCNLGILLPTQSLALLTTYTSGYYSIKDILKAGFFTSFIIITVVILMANFYWPLLGFKP